MDTEQDPQEPQEPVTQNEPDNDNGVPPLEPTVGEQGPQVSEQTDVDAPVAQSAPPPDAQTGVPAVPENEGVEGQPEYAGTVPADEADGDEPEGAESD